MSSEVEEIKRRLDIVEFIGEYLPLVRAGSGSMKTRCPFHQEKTPSFHVSRDRQSWHCFGCGEGGDIFSFLMKSEGVTFPEALERLAERAGVTIDRKPHQQEERSERQRLLDILEFATKLFEKYYVESPRAEAARSYVAMRGVNDDMRAVFRLGYAPDSWDTLAVAATTKGIPEKELLAAGLVIARERGGSAGRSVYDRFRNRLVFPIRDVHGRVVGFTARTLSDNPDEPKYINSPETLVYKKSMVLYGLDRARQEIKKQDVAVVVEGNMDVIACHQFGFTNTIAVSGTAFTVEQIGLIKRFTNTIAVAFDADAAGITAAERGIDLAVAEGLQVQVIHIPVETGKDPDEVLRADPDIWKRAVRNTIPVMDWFFSRAFAKADLGSAEAKRQIGRMLLPRIARIPDAIEQSHWLQELGRRLAVPEHVLRRVLTTPTPRRQVATKDSTATARVAPTRDLRSAERLLGIVALRPDTMSAVLGVIQPDMIVDPDLSELYKHMVMRYTSGEKPVPDPTAPALPGMLGTSVARIIASGEDALFDAQVTPDDEVRRLSHHLRQSHRRAEREVLAGRIASAEAEGNHTLLRELSQKFQALISEEAA